MDDIFKLVDEIKAGLKEAQKEDFLEVAEKHAEEGCFLIEEHHLRSRDSFRLDEIGIDEHEVIKTLCSIYPRNAEYLTRQIREERAQELAPQLAAKLNTQIETDLWDDGADFARGVAGVLIHGATKSEGWGHEGCRIPHSQALLDAVLEVIAKNAAEIIKAEHDAANAWRYESVLDEGC